MERSRLRSNAMTIGQLSRCTGVSIKVLREYERLGFLYTLGRSEGNYRLFGEEALWCVHVIQGLRSLGLTLSEIRGIVTRYREHPDEPIGELLTERLAQAEARIEARIADLQELAQRIRDFQAAYTQHARRTSAQALPPDLACLFSADPRRARRKSTARELADTS
jgi:MerR family transcriptional regulator, copper efflux regulator